MKAARLHGKQDLRIDSVEQGTVGQGEARVEVAACGICGTDLHEYEHPQFTPGEAHPTTGESRPITLGHEFSGVVTEVGEGVNRLAVGDRVAVHPNIPCGECVYCEDGDYNLCENVVTVGLHTGTGGYAESVVVGEGQIHRLPEEVADWEGALVEPLAVGLHAVRRSGTGVGDAVGVFGCGPIGLATVGAAAVAGASRIFVSEPNDARREVARELGADVAIDPTERDAVETITAETDGGVNVAFELAATEPAFDAAVRSTRRGGTITVGSISDEPVSVDLNDVVMTERTIEGTFCYGFPPRSGRTEFDAAIRLLADGNLDMEPYVTGRVGLEDIVAGGFEALLDPDTEDVKILVEP